jgi:hypothetical protein
VNRASTGVPRITDRLLGLGKLSRSDLQDQKSRIFETDKATGWLKGELQPPK